MTDVTAQTDPRIDRLVSRNRELEQQIQDVSRMKEALEERLQFEELLSEISSDYTNLPASEVDKTIEYGLERLCTFLGADRCNLSHYTGKDRAIRVTYSWAKEGVATALPRQLQGISELFPWSIDKILRGEPIVFTRPEELPDEAAIDKQSYNKFGTKSQAGVPISVGGVLVGSLGIDTLQAYRTYNEETVDRLRRAGEIFANAVARKQKELEIQNALLEIGKLKDQLEAECSYLREEIDLASDFYKMTGQSEALKSVFMKISQVAAIDVTVLVQGETGTGKELVARAIHAVSPRKERPMVKVNCAALPANLIESELFGHEKGAFTSAQARHVGRFELADGGTIFLDEIGELPLESQSKLLRVLQESEFERVGSSQTIKVDVRIIAATNRDLEEEVRKGRFRQDLWYRLNIFPITVPPLRKRTEDIPLLVNWLVNKIGRKMGKTIERIPSNTMKVLQDYHWPGNVRELENVIERAVINTQGPSLQLLDNLDTSQGAGMRAAPVSTLEETERNHIIQVLEETKWRLSGPKGAAIILGLNPSTLRFRIRKLGIQKS